MSKRSYLRRNVYESIILTYMIELDTSQKYAEMTPMDIYNITDFFQSKTKKEIPSAMPIILKRCRVFLFIQ